ncbi:MAG: SMI1/KNR4 family protein [Lachnoclostridium sp.]|nr:SMI1/KNR4 family protein [Lachnospira sp.]MCM1249287.1 SMI1/KNR4 family protein [Lachnoclostridium sp.]
MDIKYNLSLSELMDFFCDTKHMGFPLEEIEAAEKRLGVLLPQAYRDFLSAYGKDRVNTHYNQLLEPQEIYSNYEGILEAIEYDWKSEFQEAVKQGLQAEYAENPYFQCWQFLSKNLDMGKLPIENWNAITEEYILIWHENQGIWSAGYRKCDLLNGILNPPVYISINDDYDYIAYEKYADNTEEFLIKMLRDAAYGWCGGERFTSPAEIERILLNAGTDLERMKDSFGNGTCLAGEKLYFYYRSGNSLELRIANRTLPQASAYANNQQPCLPLGELLCKYEEAMSVEEPSFTEYRPKYSPRRLALLPHQMQDLGMCRPVPENGIPLHPLVALLVQETFNHEPATAYDWGKDISKIKTLTIEPRYGTARTTDEEFIYIYPPGEHFPPAPYYFDLHDWSVIGRMGKLQALTIHDIYVDDFSFLKVCKNLKRLDLYNTNFSDCRLLSELSNLKEADLRFCPLEYMEILQNLPCKVLMT